MSELRITAIQRWPVKGLGPDRLAEVELTPGRPLPLDRAWAIENGPSGFDPERPRPLPKTRFLMLMKDERLAALETRFDGDARQLTIARNGHPVARGRLDEPIGRTIIEQFFAAYMAGELRGPPKLLSAGHGTFADTGAPLVSLINLASLAELARVAGRDIDPYRFRANFHLSGLAPWQEFDLVGGYVALGEEATIRIVEPITRCAATNVDPATGARDMQVPRLLEGAFGHCEFGIYGEVVRAGKVRVADAIRRLEPGPSRERRSLPF